MSILIYAIKSTGEKNLIAVASDSMLDSVQTYCAHRNEESIVAGYNTSYKYEKSGTAIINSADEIAIPVRKVTGA